MGCHTWFYKLMETQPTREDKIECLTKKDKKFREQCVEALKNGGFTYRFGTEWYPFEDESEVREHLSLLDWRIENVKHYEDYKEDYLSIDWNNCESLTKEQELYIDVEAYDNVSDNIIMKHNGKYYENLPEFGDVFRYYEYGKVLESKTETQDLLKTLGYKEGDSVFNRVDAFWEQHPDGIIDFG